MDSRKFFLDHEQFQIGTFEEEEYKNVKPKSREPVWNKCLRCDTGFQAHSKFNRLCDPCSKRREFIGGVEPVTIPIGRSWKPI